MKGIFFNFLLLISNCILAQGGLAKDYFNKEVQQAQGKTTGQVINLLELGLYKESLEYISIDSFDSKTKLNKILKRTSLEIRKLKDSTTLSIVIVYPAPYNVYRCRYYNKNGTYFQIDLFFQEGVPNSKIVDINVVLRDVLIEEKRKNLEWQKNNPNFIPPPPPKME